MNVFRFETKRNIKACIIWSIVCGLILAFFLSIFPSMKDMGMQELVGAKLDALPSSMLKALGLEDMIDFSNILEYLAYSLQYIAMASYIYALILGVNSLLEEESTGTIEFLYSKNISRKEIVSFKILSRAFLLGLFILLLAVFTFLVTLAFKPSDLSAVGLLTGIIELFVGIGFISLVFLFIGFFLSTILKPNHNFTAISIGVFFMTYVLGVAGKLREGLAFLKYFSPYDYAMATEVVKSGIELKYILVGCAIIVMCSIGSFIIYEKKDMKI